MARVDYGRLVRDKIPAMIAAHGGQPMVRVLDDAEFIEALKKKMIETAWEVHGAQSLALKDSLADMLEVSTWLIRAAGFTPAEIFAIADEKREKRGGFAEKSFLVAVEE